MFSKTLLVGLLADIACLLLCLHSILRYYKIYLEPEEENIQQAIFVVHGGVMGDTMEMLGWSRSVFLIQNRKLSD